ncbi:uncharacterized protein [Nicotiana tomentosiformis]|uniref:uncharacterized protein n=1 Tax=Nicotiana tomentosiformis TaxID=4098 RepID=UPI00388C6C53
MAAPPNFEEGQSTYRPPRFNGQYYGWWKTRMHDFIMAEDSELWDVICDGPYAPTKKVGEPAVMVLKTRKEYNDADKKAVEKNFRAKKILVCGIGPDEYNRISACQSAKEIWEALQTAHEGTTQVKQSKIDMLTTEYELFRMNDDESIQDMHTRFTSIINELHSLGEIIPRNKLVRKVLSVLPSFWESKMNAITETKDLQTLITDELVGNLKTYEMKRKKDSERREPKKEKNLVLKAENNGSSEEDSDMAYLTRGFQKMVRRNGAKRNPVPDKCFKRKNVADNVVKQALTAWGDSSGELEEENDAGDSSMMAVENEANEYDPIFALMAQSDDDEDDDNDENFSKEKNSLVEKTAITEQERDDLLVVIVDLEETIEGLKAECRAENSEKGKEVASEAHIKLKNELNNVKTSLCVELEKNRQLQAELKKEGIGFQREKVPYNPHSKYVTVPDNWLCTHCGNNGHFKENCQARVQSVQKNKVFTEKGTVKGSSQQWIMDSGCSKHMIGNTMDFLSLKGLQ